MAFKDFPEGSVHIVAVDSNGGLGDKIVALKLEGHFFVGVDNGLFGLISDAEPSEIVSLNPDDQKHYSFPARDIMATAAAKIAQGGSLPELGTPVEAVKRLLGRSMRASKKQISGHVIRIDHYGNLITNIEQAAFRILS